MRSFLRRVFPGEFFENPAYFRAFALALVYLVFLLTQLFTFEAFPGLTQYFPLKFGQAGGVGFAVGVIVLELAALPALLSMRSSKLLWWLSRLAAVLVPLVWLAHGVVLGMLGYSGSVGLFGATLEVMSGWWFVVFMALTALTAIVITRELPQRRAT